jgi:uncharacterized protein (TIGR02246 family)
MASTPVTEPGIDALYVAWRDAYARRDIEAVVNLLTEDYVLVGAAGVLTRDALRPMLEAAFAKYDVSIEFEREEQVVSGDLAFDRGWDVQTARVRETNEMTTRRHRVFLILRREADGMWRFARGTVSAGPP